MPLSLRWPLMLLPFALWGTAMVAMRPLLEGAAPLTLAWMRLLPAGALLLLVAALMGRSLRVAAEDLPWLLLFALVDGSLFQGLLSQGLGGTGAGLGSVLIDSQPLVVALLARSLFGEAINPVGWFGLLLGLLGILCLGLPAPVLQHWWLEGPRSLGERPWSHGELWMLGAALAMAFGTVISRYACRHSDQVAITGWHMLLGSAPLLLLTPTDQLWPHWTAFDWALMSYASVFGSALAYGLFFWFASQGDLTSFSSLTFLTPLFALVCGGLFLDERLMPLQWLGALLALGSVLLIHQRAQLWQGKADGD